MVRDAFLFYGNDLPSLTSIKCPETDAQQKKIDMKALLSE